jgi:hypothetical protein
VVNVPQAQNFNQIVLCKTMTIFKSDVAKMEAKPAQAGNALHYCLDPLSVHKYRPSASCARLYEYHSLQYLRVPPIIHPQLCFAHHSIKVTHNYIMLITKPALLLLTLTISSLAQYTGPCSNSACGTEGKACPRGYLCVPYPNFDPTLRQGCTCSHG